MLPSAIPYKITELEKEMASITPGNYLFDHTSIASTRVKLKMKQAKMAQRLGIPVNTLSRWETGATIPDAKSMAAIYSLAKSLGITPQFFKEVPLTKPQTNYRSRLVVMVDFQNLGISAKNVAQFDSWIRATVEQKATSATKKHFKAFGGTNQAAAIDKFSGLKWKSSKRSEDSDDAIIMESKSNCGHDPSDTVLVIATKDGGFASLVNEMKQWGVMVYIVGPESTSQKLQQAVEKGCFIKCPSSWK